MKCNHLFEIHYHLFRGALLPPQTPPVALATQTPHGFSHGSLILRSKMRYASLAACGLVDFAQQNLGAWPKADYIRPPPGLVRSFVLASLRPLLDSFELALHFVLALLCVALHFVLARDWRYRAAFSLCTGGGGRAIMAPRSGSRVQSRSACAISHLAAKGRTPTTPAG